MTLEQKYRAYLLKFILSDIENTIDHRPISFGEWLTSINEEGD